MHDVDNTWTAMSGSPSPLAIKELRELTGHGMLDCRAAFTLAAERPEFGDDVLHALGYLAAKGLAINVRRDRDGWNLRQGLHFAERWRAQNARLANRFPTPETQPPSKTELQERDDKNEPPEKTMNQ